MSLLSFFQMRLVRLPLFHCMLNHYIEMDGSLLQSPQMWLELFSAD